jgi:uncharacterized repeat protein (TIGR01451 family)
MSESARTADGGEGSERQAVDGPSVTAGSGDAAGRERREQVPATLTDRHDTDRLRIVGAAVLVAVGAAALLQSPGLLLASVVGVGVLAYRQASTVESPSLAVGRSISDPDPEPEDVVTVETTITNVGERTLTDCRFVDRVPAELSVVDGSPRRATMLRLGESCTLTYDVEAQRGAHAFEGVYAAVSDPAGTVANEYALEAPDTIRCSPRAQPIRSTLLRSMTTPYAGRLATDKPGEGLEFHATREYRPGDALRRIDWNQYASTGELATLQFRTERAASVVVIADVRPSSYVRAGSDDPHAADRCVEAASRLFVTLLEEDHRAGIATFGPDYWLAPNAGTDHRHRALSAFGTEPALSPSRPEGTYPVRLRLRWLRRRLPSDAQVILCTPLLDWSSETAVQVLESHGHEVTVVSPDPTGTDTTGERVARLERRNRIRDVHQLGVPVVDWATDESLDIALARAARGWSR